jgi:hypothetical protein
MPPTKITLEIHELLTHDTLKQCADITFAATGTSPETCTNQTGITADFLSADTYYFANESASHSTDHDHGSEESHNGTDEAAASSTGAADASETPASDSGAMMLTTGWMVLGAGVLGAVALL